MVHIYDASLNRGSLGRRPHSKLLSAGRFPDAANWRRRICYLRQILKNYSFRRNGNDRAKDETPAPELNRQCGIIERAEIKNKIKAKPRKLGNIYTAQKVRRE